MGNTRPWRFGQKVYVKTNIWIAFLKSQEHLLFSLWDLIPQPVTILSIEYIPFNNGPLLEVEYLGYRFVVYEDDLDFELL